MTERIDKAALRSDRQGIAERIQIPARSRPYLLLVLLIYVATFIVLFLLVSGLPGQAVVRAQLVPPVILAAFIFETLDSAAGMGFGTTLGALLLLIGYSPLETVPVLLATSGLVGILAGGAHNQFRNVEVSWPPNAATRALMLIAGCSAAGTLIAVVVAYFAIPLPKTAIKTWVAIAAILLGAGALARKWLGGGKTYRPRRLAFFAALGGVNKGVGSGGHGIVTLGALLSGVHEKSATAITTTAEGIASLVGAITFVVLSLTGATVADWGLLPSLWIGAFPAAVVGPFAVRALPTLVWRYLIPVYSILIGSLLLIVLYGFGSR